MDEVLAVMFSGSGRPTTEDYKHALLLICRDAVANALRWLILNHPDYSDVTFSSANLDGYSEDAPIVSVEYFDKSGTKNAEGVSVHDSGEDGTASGDCVFAVYGLLGEQTNHMKMEQLRAIAITHLDAGGKFMRTSHAADPQSLWHNPRLYAKMFPWLFPYGLGAVGTLPSISDADHKKYLLVYHDKRFQTDISFPFVAFSHEQVKAAAGQSFLLADRKNFSAISDRFLSLDQTTLMDLATRMANGEYVKPETEEQTKCFSVLKDLDSASKGVKGSITSKKYMQNEIWSLVTFLGAPSWYITLAPCDHKHPIAVYFADNEREYEVPLRSADVRHRLLGNNPVASARFFDYIVRLFLKHVVGDADSKYSIFGPSSGYYCTVEEQGRRALHLHGVLFLLHSLSPQQVRDKLLDESSPFQRELLAYLESVRIGEFMTGSGDNVKDEVTHCMAADDYTSPELTLPIPPPVPCSCTNENCQACGEYTRWLTYFDFTVDDLLTKSNVHDCLRAWNKDGSLNAEKWATSCMNNPRRSCKARFPRATYESSSVDRDTGHINLKKKQSNINDIAPAGTYLIRGNTDVTSLLSGTAIKAVILYVSDYITKSGLKTHVIFDSIQCVLEKNTEILNGTLADKDKARRLLTKVVNLLTTKLELGSPMISLYLLQNEDHYTSHNFVPFYWPSFVKEARRFWYPNEIPEHDKLVLVKRRDNKLVGLSSHLDYTHRPAEHHSVCLFDWIVRYLKVSIPKSGKLGNGLRFTDGHPLAPSHMVRQRYLYERYVPNFIGGLLPRRDKGDRELYCCTMLVFFKPWRSGEHLKRSTETWHEAFSAYTFDARYETYMNNMNLRYECLDARDDFRAQLLNGDISDMPAFPANFDVNVISQASSHLHLGDLPVPHDDPEDIVLYDADAGMLKGKQYLKREAAMRETYNVMTRSGWTNIPSDGSGQKIDIAVPSVFHRPAEEWDKIIAIARTEVLEDQKKQAGDPTRAKSSPHTVPPTDAKYRPNVVEICDKTFFEHIGAEYGSIEKLTADIVSQFSLNSEQERTFRIIAHHSTGVSSERLNMYIGGMGGTGKSQVVKALLKFLSSRSMSFAIVMVAPTGTAAALLGGSTYHYILGFNSKTEEVRSATMSQVVSRLEGVDYMILDEVSMLACGDMYKVSERMARAKNNHAEPFGGVNMVFAGDFAQLPPVAGGESSSLYSRVVGSESKANTYHRQCASIGKALWHQVTTVVILRKNMRDTGSTVADIRYRTALENTRYKACTKDDVNFLNSLVSSPEKGRHFLGASPWRDAPVIVGENLQKDEINRLGCQRFAAETGQSLRHFYCEDIMSQKADNTKGDNKKARSTKNSAVNLMSRELQEVLWTQPPACHETHSPAVLSLCYGLPVILRYNVATELSVTKGQRGTVYAWHSSIGSFGREQLDVLFVLLLDPPSPVQLPNLPPNVVPITKRKSPGYVYLPDDTKIFVTRNQVTVLPGFAMTAHSAQGASLSSNTCDLNTLDTHQSFYTALSRSKSVAKTAIVQGFDAKQITGNASGALRREFRELELLDDITRLRFERKLDSSVVGSTRAMLLESFLAWKGPSYKPSHVHSALRWTAKDPYVQEPAPEILWTLVSKQDFENKKKKPNAATKQSLPKAPLVPPPPLTSSNVTRKRKVSDLYPFGDTVLPSSKRTTTGTDIGSTHIGNSPRRPSGQSLNDSRRSSGRRPSDNQKPARRPSAHRHISYLPRLIWANNSCAYDSILPVLYRIWADAPAAWTNYYHSDNMVVMSNLVSRFRSYVSGVDSMEDIRDYLRLVAQQISPSQFRFGAYCSASVLIGLLLRTDVTFMQVRYICPECQYWAPRRGRIKYLIVEDPTSDITSISQWIHNLPVRVGQTVCPQCDISLGKHFFPQLAPRILAFAFDSTSDIRLDVNFAFAVQGDDAQYTLRGVVYHSTTVGHYVSRVIGTDGRVWFHDEMRHGGMPVLESGSARALNLSTIDTYQATMAIYVRCD